MAAETVLIGTAIGAADLGSGTFGSAAAGLAAWASTGRVWSASEPGAFDTCADSSASGLGFSGFTLSPALHYSTHGITRSGKSYGQDITMGENLACMSIRVQRAFGFGFLFGPFRGILCRAESVRR